MTRLQLGILILVASALCGGGFMLLAGGGSGSAADKIGKIVRQDGDPSKPGYKVRLTEFVPDKTTIDGCYDKYRGIGKTNGENGNLGNCLNQAYGNLAYDEGPKVALALMAKNETRLNEELTACHQVAHMIGGAAFKYHKGNAGKALADGDIACGSGYYHGLMQRALMLEQGADIEKVMPKMCGWVEPQSGIAIQCGHGLGHSVMLATLYDLPRSLKACKMQPSNADIDACHTGAFMENRYTEFGLRSKYQKEEDLVYPCNDRKVLGNDDKVQRICYTSVMSRAAVRIGPNISRLAKMCSGIEARFKGACFGELGQLVGQKHNFHVNKIAEDCPIFKQYGWEGICWRGAVIMKIEFSGSAPDGVRICNAAPKEHEARCWYGVGRRLNMTTKQTVDTAPLACSDLTKDPTLLIACANGIEGTEEYEGGDAWPLPDPGPPLK